MGDETVNFDSLTLVWLDQMGNSTQANREIQEKLRSIVHYLRTFEKCDECENYLRSFTSAERDEVLLIVSGRFAEEILRRVSHLNPIQFIFIFCMDEQKYQSLMKTYPKVRGVLVRLFDLFQTVDRHARFLNANVSPISSVSRLDRSKIFSHLLEIPWTLIDRRELLERCAKFYAGNSKETLNVQEFEHCYSSSKACQWFFNETFLSRWLNKALRTFDVDQLYRLRFFLQDLEEALHSSPSISTAVLYSGQWFTREDLQQIVEGQSRRFHSYFFAKRERADVLKALDTAPIVRSNVTPIVVEIEHNSLGKEIEEKILFPISSELVVLHFDGISRLKIRLFDTSKKRKRRRSIDWPYLFLQLGQWDLAERCFAEFVRRYPGEKVLFLVGLSRLHEARGHFDRALDYSFQCLPLLRHDRCRSSLLNDIGVFFAKKEQFESALDFFQQSASLRRNDDRLLALSYSNLATVYSAIGRRDLALEFYLKAQKIRSSPTIELNLADCLDAQNSFDEALKCYLHSVDLQGREEEEEDSSSTVYHEDMIDDILRQKERNNE